MIKVKNKKNNSKNKLKILNTASTLFTRNGVRNTSLSDIAKESNLSKGTLYYYYTTKNELITDITEQYMTIKREKIKSLLENSTGSLSTTEILSKIYDIILKEDHRGRLHIQLLHYGLTECEEIKILFRKRYIEWKTFIKKFLKNILPENYNSETLTNIILASLDGYIVQSMLSLDDEASDKVADFLLK